MELRVNQKKLLPGNVDLTSQSTKFGDFVCTPIHSEIECHRLVGRWSFYQPVSPDFKGTDDDLKLLTCPGDGYFPDIPWCTFPRAYNYELDIYLDLTPHTVFSDK